jgi:hypothetical protein
MQFGEDGHHSSVNVGQPVMRIPPSASAITGLQFAHVCDSDDFLNHLEVD